MSVSTCSAIGTPTAGEAALALAQANAAAIVSANASMDMMWLIFGGAMVFFMHSGFALLEVGSVSVRNTQNILFKNILSPTVSAFLFWAFGYAIAYGEPGNAFMGSIDATAFTTGVDVTVTTTCAPTAACADGQETSCPAAAASSCECLRGGSDCVFTETADGYTGSFYAGWYVRPPPCPRAR